MLKRSSYARSLTLIALLVAGTAVARPQPGRAAVASPKAEALNSVERQVREQFPSVALDSQATLDPAQELVAGQMVSGMRAVRFESREQSNRPWQPALSLPSEGNAGAAGGLRVFYPASYDEPFVIELGEQRVVLRAIGAHFTQAAAAAGKLFYTSPHDSVDVIEVPSSGRSEELLLLHDARAPRVFEYEIVEIRGVAGLSLQDGAVRFAPDHAAVPMMSEIVNGRFTTPQPSLQIDRPWVIDANGRRSESAAQWTIIEELDQPRRLRLTINPDPLVSPLIVISSVTTTHTATGHPKGLTQPAPDSNTVLILGSTVIGGVASLEATQAAALGYTVQVVSDTEWAAKTTADFATYRAIVLGDPRCIETPAPVTAADTNKAVWSPAITGNTIIVGTDPAYHSNAGTSGATQLTNTAIGFAAADPGHTGAYIALSCYYASAASGTTVPLLSGFGAFTVQGFGRDHCHIVATSPALTGSTDASLSNWSESIHEIFNSFPVSFNPLVITTDAPSTTVGFRTFGDGSSGVPYILARGSTLSPVGLQISKSAAATVTSGAQLTYTINYGNNGGTTATGVVIKDTLPAGTTFVSASNGGANVGGVVTYNIGSLAGGTLNQTVTLTVHVTAASCSTVVNDTYTIESAGVSPVGGFPTSTTVDASSAPTITNINPTTGPSAGGQSVTITGTTLCSAISVSFGGTAGTIAANTSTSITATAPPHAAGAVNVGVTTAGGSATSIGGYTYVAAPTITNVNPTGGPVAGGQSVTITGTNLTGATSVTFGGTAGTITANTAASITVTTLAHTAGAVNVVVTTPGGSATSTGGYTYASSLDGTFSATGPLGMARLEHTATLLPNGKILIAGGYNNGTDLNSAELYDPASGTFSATGPLGTARDSHTATLLPNGKVLIAGGVGAGSVLTSAELYDPASGTFSATGPLGTARDSHTATLLKNGKVLLAGGAGAGYLTSAELYDPASGTFSATGPLGTARYSHTATLLPNGKVLIAAGYNAGALTSAELYDPAVGTFNATGPLGTARDRHSGTLLPNGKVLIAGGFDGSSPLSSAEVYDPASGTFSATGPLGAARLGHTATLLPNGKVLIVGGDNGSTGLSSTELYDPASGTFSATGSLGTAREVHTATLLPNGKVLIAGGFFNGSSLSSAELYDPASGTFSATGPLATARYGHTGTLLPNGKVLIAGGGTGASVFASAELYDPASETFSATGPLGTGRYYHTATLLPNGKVLIAGGSNPSTGLSSAEVYDPASGTFSATGPLGTGRYYHTATLLPNGKVLIAGGSSGSDLNSAEVYDAASGTFSATGPLGTARDLHTGTLLPNGKVLIADGWGNSGRLTSAELYDVGDGYTDSRRPLISSAPAAFTEPASMTLGGSGFRGDSEASSGSTNSSPTNYPLLQLERLDNEQTLFVTAGSDWSDTSFTSATLSSLVTGYYRATILTNAIPSLSQIILIAAPTPTITNISPTSGPAAGGQSVTITGTNLTGATSVTFGGTAGTITANTETSVTVTTLAQTAGAVNVVVTTANGSATSTNGYTYVAAPTITNINPTSGPAAGGQSVTITGTNLTGATSVIFGGAAGTITGNTATSITVTTLAHTAGAVNVVVTTAGGSATSTGGYTYVAASTITNINPTSGPVAGGQSVVVTGTNLSSATSVTFGGTVGTITANNATSITVTTPGHASGAVNVVVTTAGGSATLTGGYTFVAAPTITSINPTSGPSTGGQSVTITGTNLSSATSVTFGGTSGTITGNTSTSITVTTPAHAAGAVNVVVTTAGGSATSTGGYTFVAAPTITSINPTSGPSIGGQSVTITGTNLSSATSVTFGGTSGTITGNTSTSITVTTPAHAVGAVNVVVTTAGGSATSTGGYTYVAAPTITNINPTSGPSTGGQSVTITGTNMSSATSVTFGGTAGTITGNTSTSITVTTPAHATGAVNVVATTAGGSASSPGAYTYSVSNGSFSATGQMTTARLAHTATLLPNGKVLIAAGRDAGNDALASAELYDSASGMFSATTGPLATSRYSHTATLLANGKVLITGGTQGNGGQPSAELYDPSSDTFSATAGASTTARYLHTATLLSNGKVLIVGGYNFGYLSSAELYDPASGRFSTTGPLVTARYSHTATLLSDGKVLITGGYDTHAAYSSSAELYDPGSGTFSATTGVMTTPRYLHTATLLGSGKVLISGGNTSLSSAEVYDPASWTFSGTTGAMTTARASHTATILANGKALTAGGYNNVGYLSSAESYDSGSGTFSATTGAMTTARGYHTATLLPNGKVLLAGGLDGSSTLSSAELYDPGDIAATPTNVVAAATAPSSITITWTLTGATTYEVLRLASGGVSTTIGSSTSGTFTDSTASPNTAYLYKVRAISPSVSPYSAPDLATTVIFTDPSLIPGATSVKATHFTELRTAVNAVRTLAGLSAGSYTDSTIIPGFTRVKAAHVTDLRSALDAARSALLLPAVSFTRTSIVAGTTTISVVDINDLRNGVQ